jgi:hypothetical protein
MIHDYTDARYDYVAFVDNADLLKMKTFGHWQIRPLAYSQLDNIRNARWHKTHPHVLFPEYEVSVWVDGNANPQNEFIFNKFEQALTLTGGG